MRLVMKPGTNYTIKGEAFYVQCDCLGFGENEMGRIYVWNCRLGIAAVAKFKEHRKVQKNFNIFSGNSTSFNSEFFDIAIFSSWKRKQVPSCIAWSDYQVLGVNLPGSSVSFGTKISQNQFQLETFFGSIWTTSIWNWPILISTCWLDTQFSRRVRRLCVSINVSLFHAFNGGYFEILFGRWFVKSARKRHKCNFILQKCSWYSLPYEGHAGK